MFEDFEKVYDFNQEIENIGKYEIASWLNDGSDDVDPPGIYDFGYYCVKAMRVDDGRVRGYFPPYFAKYIGFHIPGVFTRDVYVGEELLSKGHLMWKSPRKLDKIRKPLSIDQRPFDYAGFEMILEHAVNNEARVGIDESPSLITSIHKMDDEKYKKLSEIFFEVHNTPSLDFYDSSVLALISTGVVDGVVVESGSSITQSTPIINSSPLSHAKLILENPEIEVTKKLEKVEKLELPGRINPRHSPPRFEGEIQKRISGEFVTDLFHKKLVEKYPQLSRTPRSVTEENFRFRTIEEMKKELCYVKLFDNYNEIPPTKYNNNNNKDHDNKSFFEYYLPDDTKLMIPRGQDWMSEPTEILFNPSLVEGYGVLPGIHHITKLSIERCDSDDTRDRLLRNPIVLFGGTTLTKNFKERFELELRKLFMGQKFSTIITEDGIGSACRGGMIASMNQKYYKNFVKQKEYDEMGWKQAMIKRWTRFSSKYVKHDLSVFEGLKNMTDEDQNERIKYVLENYYLMMMMERTSSSSSSQDTDNIIISIGGVGDNVTKLNFSKFLLL